MFCKNLFLSLFSSLINQTKGKEELKQWLKKPIDDNDLRSYLSFGACYMDNFHL